VDVWRHHLWSLSWSRPVRFAGVHVATDFSLEPDLVTQPLPRFFGQTTVPAGVDVFVNAAKVLEAPSTPARLRSATSRLSQVVEQSTWSSVTSSDVRSRIPFPFIRHRSCWPAASVPILRCRRATPLLWSAQLRLRRSVAEATLAYGLSDRLTLEGHSEASADVFVGVEELSWRYHPSDH